MMPWSFKKSITAGRDGRLTLGDGRAAEEPKANLGMNGMLAAKNHVPSATFDGPNEAFDDTSERSFKRLPPGGLLGPVQLNARFFDMAALPSLAASDVIENLVIEPDFAHFDAHLTTSLGDIHHAAS